MMIVDTDIHTSIVYRNTSPKMATDINVGHTSKTKTIMEVLNTTDAFSMDNQCLGLRLGKGCVIFQIQSIHLICRLKNRGKRTKKASILQTILGWHTLRPLPRGIGPLAPYLLLRVLTES